jgi:hypothetical protein
MANITTFQYLGQEYDIEWNEHDGYPYYAIDCDGVIIEFSHPDAGNAPITMITNHNMKKKVKKQVGKFMAQFIMPLRNKIAPGYTIYLMMYENDYRKWSMLT